MNSSNRLPQNSADYLSVPDDPADWAFMMQQWTKIKNSIPDKKKKPNLPTLPSQILKPVKSEVVESPTSLQILEPIKSEVVELPTTSQIFKSVKSEVVELPSSSQNLKPVKSEVELPTTPQILVPVKSEVVELPSSLQILQPVKSEVVELPTASQILAPVKSEIIELPTSRLILDSVKSEVIEAPSLTGMDFKKTPTNVDSNTPKETPLVSKIQDRSKKKKKKHKKGKHERSKGKKSDVLSHDAQRDGIDNSVTNNYGNLSTGPQKSRFSRASSGLYQLIHPPSKENSLQKNMNGTSLIRKTKDELMEESLLKIRKLLTKFLMETTENQVSIIAEEEFKRAKLISTQSVQKRCSVLTSLSGELGLKIYDSDDSDDSEKLPNERDQSDEELLTLIDQRQRNFEKIEMQIDLEIESRKEKEESITHQEEMRKKCIIKNDFEGKKVDENRLLKSTLPSTKNVKSKITRSTNKIVPGSHNLLVDALNKLKEQQNSGIQSTILKNGVTENPKNTESIRENCSSSSSTLSPSSLSSTTSPSSRTCSSSSSSSHSSRSDSDSDSDSRTRRVRKIRANTKSSSSRTTSYARHCRSPSKKYRRTTRSPNRRSPYRRNKSNTRRSSSYRKGDSPRRFWSHNSRSRSYRRRESSVHSYSRRYRYRSDSSESRRSSYERRRRK